tara:strand:+ start:2569 stop:3945 length:1377 start_codon:yes stop_codon:yes gene_type:complete
MAQTITIKQSSSTDAPTTLVNGELAYSSSSNKLWIGRPGGLTSNVDAIGGKYFTDRSIESGGLSFNTSTGVLTINQVATNLSETVDLDGRYIRDKATTTALGGIKIYSGTVQSVSAQPAGTTALRTYGIQLNSLDQAVVNVPWTNTQYTAGTGLTLSGTTFNANVDGTNSTTAENSTTTADRTYKVQVDSGDNLVVNVPWTGGNLSTVLGLGNYSGSNDIKIKNDRHIQYGDSVSNNLQISYDTTNSRAEIKEVGSGGLLIQGEYMMLRGDDGISGMNITPTSGQTYDDISFQIGNLGAQLYVTASGVGFATGQNVTSIETSTSLSSSNTSLSTTGAVKSYVDGKLGNFTLSGDTLSTSGSTVTVDDAVIITGDLTVQGTTTTVDSTTVVFKDNILLLNKDYSGSTPSADAGLEVERGTLVNAYLVWDESTDRWSVGTALNALSPLNVENIAIDGGTF